LRLRRETIYKQETDRLFKTKQMADLVVRDCEYRDLDRVEALEKATFPDRPYRRSDFLLFLILVRKGFQVGMVGNSLAGYVIATGRNGEGMIFSIAVAPEFRRRGFGEALLMSAVNHLALKYRRAYLLVDERNEDAIRLYRKHLFKETGNVIKRYYPNGDDAIEMVRGLSEGQDPASKAKEV
jgi:ribosomal-protein-alanine N-acetyltransferase